MPTIPPSRPESVADSHHNRRIAESFGVDAARYDRARPRYPETFLAALVAEFPGRSVLDVGCGTGIVARQLQVLGYEVLGVEPDPRMAAYARDTGIAVELATLETWDPAGRIFDAVVAGQTWHWVDPVVGAQQAARALRPRGVFSVFWNVEQPAVELAAAFADVYRTASPDSMHARRWATQHPDPYGPLRAKTIAGLDQGAGFDEPREHHVTWQRTYSRDQWLDQLPTQGGHADLADDTTSAIYAGIGAAIDRVGGRFVMHCTTTAVTARRLDDPRKGQDSECRKGSTSPGR